MAYARLIPHLGEVLRQQVFELAFEIHDLAHHDPPQTNGSNLTPYNSIDRLTCGIEYTAALAPGYVSIGRSGLGFKIDSAFPRLARGSLALPRDSDNRRWDG